MKYETILFAKEDNVAIVTLDKANSLNSINTRMIQELLHVFNEINADDSLRCLLLTGNGKAFCSGQDLKDGIEMVRSSEPNTVKKKVELEYNVLIRTIRNMDIPVVAAVNGIAAGAGVSLALACDIVLCSQKARFIQSFVNIGLIPDSGGTFFLPRLIGYQNAAALAFSGNTLTADDAKSMGMVYKIFDEEQFGQKTLSFAKKLANLPTQSIANTKKLLQQSLQNDLEKQLALEAKWQQKSSETYDCKEGINAFLEKRAPKYKGK